MSPDSQQQEIPVVAFVFEGSLLVAEEWRSRRLHEYCTHILKRLTETHQARLKLAFISYGSADTLPSPIICKRFFMDFTVVFREMSEDISRLGVGMTNAGGKRGMAALDGLVAALELFDILLTQPQGTARVFASHVIHIASAAPDASQHPSWNDSPTFDDTTWETLPGEMKKRNIQFSSINLRPSLPHYQELHAALTTGGSTPWFNVRSPHTLYLASFVVPTATKLSSTKRANDPPMAPERAPEPKRMRIQPIAESPKPVPKPIAVPSQPVIPSQPLRPAQDPPTQVPKLTPSAPPANALAITKLQQQTQIKERMRSATETLIDLERQIKAAQAQGDTQKAESLAVQYRAKKELHLKFVQALSGHQGKLTEPQAQGQSQAQTQPQHRDPANISHNSALSQEPFAPPFAPGGNSLSIGNLPAVPSGVPTGSDARDIATRSVSEMSVTTNLSPAMAHAPPINAATNMQSQMQKMIDQRLRLGGVGNAVVGGMPNPMNIGVSRTDGPSTRSNALPGSSQSPQQQQLSQQISQQQNPGAKSQMVPVWSGSMNWSGHGSAGKKDVRIYVVATSAKASECRVDTWPQALHLVPTRETGVTLEELQAWMKRHQPALCTFQVQSKTPEPRMNEYSYQALVQLLVLKNLYATAAWTTPSGGQTSNMLIFPVSGVGLAGAVFPLTGLPELPKASAPQPKAMGMQPNSIVSMGSTGIPFEIPPQLAARLSQIVPEQRPMILSQLVARHRQLQQQQQQQQSQQQQQQHPQAQMPHNLEMSGSSPFNLQIPHGMNNHANAAVLNLMNTQNSNGMMMGMSPSMVAALPRMASNNIGGAVPNLSFDMMQSFMSRNAENGMNMNPQGSS